MKQLLTPETAAEQLAVSVKTVKNLLRSGKLRGVKVGNLWRLREEALEEYLKDLVHNSAMPLAPRQSVASKSTKSRKLRTPLGRQLWKIRSRVIASGEPLLGWKEIEQEIAERRGETE